MAEIVVDKGSASVHRGITQEALHEPSSKQPQGSNNRNADKIPEEERPQGGSMSEEAERIAQLLTISPDLVNITVNVGFNTKVVLELWHPTHNALFFSASSPENRMQTTKSCVAPHVLRIVVTAGRC
jgi:hypothetical protein